MNFFCLPVSFFSFKSTFSVSLVLPSLHLCKNHKTLDLIMILQHNLTSKMVTQLSNHYSTWCNGITRFKWSNQWEIQQKLSTDPIHGPPVWSKKADLLCISGMQRRLIHYGEDRAYQMHGHFTSWHRRGRMSRRGLSILSPKHAEILEYSDFFGYKLKFFIHNS